MAMMSCSVSNDSFSEDPLTVQTSPTWNLYDNPCYSRRSHRKVTRSFWDLSGCKSSMDSDLGHARAEIYELKSEVEMERKGRKKTESACRKLVKEICKERKEHEELSMEYAELVKEMEITKSEMESLRVEFEDEMKMMKMVEGLREERVQMKLLEAKLLFEEKYNKLLQSPASADKHNNIPENVVTLVMGTKVSTSSSPVYKCNSNIAIFASAESGNPHIKQGIRGFVEFPGSKNKLLVTRLETQRSQICTLLKQKSHMKSCKLVPKLCFGWSTFEHLSRSKLETKCKSDHITVFF